MPRFASAPVQGLTPLAIHHRPSGAKTVTTPESVMCLNNYHVYRTV